METLKAEEKYELAADSLDEEKLDSEVLFDKFQDFINTAKQTRAYNKNLLDKLKETCDSFVSMFFVFKTLIVKIYFSNFR